MTTPTPSPNYRTGKICYIEIPAIDISESAQFYQQVFGWHIRQHDDGSTAFDDTIGEVSGMWVPGRPPSTDPGLTRIHHGRECRNHYRGHHRRRRRDRAACQS